MKRIMVRETTPVPPFGEPARELRILNKPLWLLQRDLLAKHCKGGTEIDDLADLPATTDEELLVCKDNLLFNDELINTFVDESRASGHACQIAFSLDDKAITTHALPLQEGIRQQDDVYVADLFYYPADSQPRHTTPRPLVIDTQAYEMGYYHIPSYMAKNQGELVFQVPNRVFLSIESWVHVYIASTPMGVFNQARQHDEKMQRARIRNVLHWTKEELGIFWDKFSLSVMSLWEQINPLEEKWRNHFLSCKKLVTVGKNCSIDPTAIIHGPTDIGDNVYIGPGAVITNSKIGNNVNIMQGAQVMLSVISDRCFLPFNSGVFMSSMMENSMIAQNTTLQVCVVGRNTFIGANTVFTDFHLRGEDIRTYHRGRLEKVGMPVLGSAIGHNCRIGSGFIVYPGRMIGSNTILVYAREDINLIRKNVNVPDMVPGYGVPGYGRNEHEYVDDSDERPETRYFWPRVVDPETGELRDPTDLPPPIQSPAPQSHTDSSDHTATLPASENATRFNGTSTHQQHEDTETPDSLQMKSQQLRAPEVHVGG
jgi:carbonic anhydrase/acetyltransferase-like protein (isoleucine patch superfamily)